MTACDRIDCRGGTVDGTGYCDACGRKPLARQAEPPAPASVRSDFLTLPVFEFPEPSSRVQRNPRTPTRGRQCGHNGCTAEIGGGYAGQEPLAKGFCPQCGHPFSFLPSLRAGDVVGGQYRVLGPLTHGGLGWVYLGEDTRLDNNRVAIKGMINAGDAALAEPERRALTAMDHPNIVRIYNYVTHLDADTGDPREYIVMEYVDGMVLEDIRRAPKSLGEPLRAEHVVIIGLQVLDAFDHLHGRGLVYCDMKPDNVIVRPGHGDGRQRRVKLIDLGAVRPDGFRGPGIIGTRGFQVDDDEIGRLGVTVRSDLHTLGKTLRDVYKATADFRQARMTTAADNPVSLGLESFERVLDRAADPVAENRFASAREVHDQLEGVLREIACLRDRTPRPTTSKLFNPSPVLLDDGLGAVPPLTRWTTDDRRPLDGLPTPAAGVLALPVLAPGADDPVIATPAGAIEPRRVLHALRDDPGKSVEVSLWRCRALVELSRFDEAAESLAEARALAGGAADRDWRITWHRGLLNLGRADVKQAQRDFHAVWAALPGEVAPKLALGFCAEHADKPADARRWYTAVWRRDRALGSAAFGLARLSLRAGDRAGAVEVLDEVPRVSRHHEAAGVAAVAVLCGLGTPPPADRATGAAVEAATPTTAELEEAVSRLPSLYLDGEARPRLIAVVREAALRRCRLADRRDWDVDGGQVFGRSPTGEALRRLLEESYQALARQAGSADEHALLVDLANQTRPMTRF